MTLISKLPYDDENTNMHRNRRLNFKAHMSILDSDSTKNDSWIDKRYHMRPDELDKTHQYDFKKYFDIVKSQPVSEKPTYYGI